jgi:hypothetical protein
LCRTCVKAGATAGADDVGTINSASGGVNGAVDDGTKCVVNNDATAVYAELEAARDGDASDIRISK